MLSYLDQIIFPKRCEIIEIIPSQRYVYPIFKNGSSSLYQQAKISNWRIRLNEQIRRCNIIDVVIKDPQQRFLSGINTFIQWTIRDHPELDADTVAWFAQQYPYLDRHYATQFMWLVNLARYLDPEAQLRFLSMADLDQLTQMNRPPDCGFQEITQLVETQIMQLPNYQMYQKLDQIIVEHCMGKSLTFKELIIVLKEQDRVAYDFVVGHSQQILGPIHALSQT